VATVAPMFSKSADSRFFGRNAAPRLAKGGARGGTRVACGDGMWGRGAGDRISPNVPGARSPSGLHEDGASLRILSPAFPSYRIRDRAGGPRTRKDTQIPPPDSLPADAPRSAVPRSPATPRVEVTSKIDRKEKKKGTFPR